MRFPCIPTLESYFCLKLFTSVIGKTITYSIGLMSIQNYALLFLSALMLNVWLLPVMYVLAVPYGDNSAFRMDRDMLIQLGLLVVDSGERESALQTLSEGYEFVSSFVPRWSIPLQLRMDEKALI